MLGNGFCAGKTSPRRGTMCWRCMCISWSVTGVRNMEPCWLPYGAFRHACTIQQYQYLVLCYVLQKGHLDHVLLLVHCSSMYALLGGGVVCVQCRRVPPFAGFTCAQPVASVLASTAWVAAPQSGIFPWRGSSVRHTCAGEAPPRRNTICAVRVWESSVVLCAVAVRVPAPY